MSQPKTDYERLYHVMNRRRGEELKKLEAAMRSIIEVKAAFIETDRQLEYIA